MGKLMDKSDTEVLKTASNFGFSAARLDTLGATEYTLVNIAIDVSGSVQNFKSELEKAYKNIIQACRKHPRSENLLVRGTTFNTTLGELHGFVALDNINEDGINLLPYGGTALYDATAEGVEAIEKYGGVLSGQDYLVNGLLVVISDGEENSSKTANTQKIKKSIEDIRHNESLESLKVIVIGIGSASTYLDDFHKDIAADQFAYVQDADAKSLAKMANFVSRSISSSSQALGTGGASQNLAI